MFGGLFYLSYHYALLFTEYIHPCLFSVHTHKRFIKKHYLEEMNYQSEKETHSTINSYYFMTALIGDVILDIVVKDAMLAIFSFAFIFFWLRVNTQSWFLAFVGLFEIFFSIPIAWFIFTVIFQINYFATLNSLALFVVVSICI